MRIVRILFCLFTGLSTLSIAGTPAPERDPFELPMHLLEVSPRQTGSRQMSQINNNVAVLKRELKLKALARGNGVGIAQIQWNKQIITASDGDELDFDGNRYMVRIDDDGLLLRGTSAPQHRIRVR